jgi:hypothetical protein
METLWMEQRGVADSKRAKMPEFAGYGKPKITSKHEIAMRALGAAEDISQLLQRPDFRGELAHVPKATMGRAVDEMLYDLIAHGEPMRPAVVSVNESRTALARNDFGGAEKGLRESAKQIFRLTSGDRPLWLSRLNAIKGMKDRRLINKVVRDQLELYGKRMGRWFSPKMTTTVKGELLEPRDATELLLVLSNMSKNPRHHEAANTASYLVEHGRIKEAEKVLLAAVRGRKK